MFIIVELALALLGVYILITGSAPRFVVDLRRYTLDAPDARVIAVALVLPVPLSLVLTLVLIVVMDRAAQGIAPYLEPAALVLCTLLFFALQYLFQRPVGDAARLPADAAAREAALRRSARQAVLFAMLATLGIPAPLLSPLAYRRAQAGEALIARGGVEPHLKGLLRVTRIASAVIFVAYAGVALWGVARALTQGG